MIRCIAPDEDKRFILITTRDLICVTEFWRADWHNHHNDLPKNRLPHLFIGSVIALLQNDSLPSTIFRTLVSVYSYIELDKWIAD